MLVNFYSITALAIGLAVTVAVAGWRKYLASQLVVRILS